MASEKQYIELFQANKALIAQHSCELFNQLRDEAAQCLQEMGMPSTHNENYKYTHADEAFAPDYGINIKRLKFPIDGGKAFRCSIPNIGSSLYYMIGDHFVASQRNENTLPEGIYIGSICDYDTAHPGELQQFYGTLAKSKSDAIIALNTMLAQDGLLVKIEDGVKIDQIIQVVNIARADMDMMTNRRLLIIMGNDSECSMLFCEHTLDSHQMLTTQVEEIFLGKNSRLSICSIEETNENNKLFNHIEVKQETGSHFDGGYFTLCGGITRRSAHYLLNDEDASVKVYGGIISDKQQHTDNNLLIDHKSPKCKSDVLFRYVLDDESVGAFAGKVLVREGAQQSDSLETNANLCVSSKARMYTQPMLEIYADDVKCNHGSTVGQLDEKALFYMAQRGIPTPEATTLLKEAFLGEAIKYIPIEPLRERLTLMVEQRFRHKTGACGGCGLCGTKNTVN